MNGLDLSHNSERAHKLANLVNAQVDQEGTAVLQDMQQCSLHAAVTQRCTLSRPGYGSSTLVRFSIVSAGPNSPEALRALIDANPSSHCCTQPPQLKLIPMTDS